MTLPRALLLSTALLGCLALSGCKSASEQAEAHFANGAKLAQAGDTPRAMVELRRVFELDGSHRAARQLYAELLRAGGDAMGAFAQLLRLVEQYPDDLAARWALVDLAIAAGNWPEAERHLAVAERLAPQAPETQIYRLAVSYQAALTAEDSAAKARIAAQVTPLLALAPQISVGRKIVIERAVTGGTPESALPLIEAGLRERAAQFDLHLARVQILSAAGKTEAAEAALAEMAKALPQNPAVRQVQLRWYLSQGNKARAAEVLRAAAGAPDGPSGPHLAYIGFLRETEGVEPALQALDTLIKANPETGAIYHATALSLRYETGDEPARQSALEQMKALVQATPASDLQRKMQVALARMLDLSGARPEAKAQLDAVLTQDANHVEALKLRATWAIAAGASGAAIVDLRAAAGQAGADPEIPTLLAAAYAREGEPDLARGALAQAVEVSGQGAAEALRYAAFLRAEGRDAVAQTVLQSALAAGESFELQLALAQLYLETGRAAEVERLAAAVSAARPDAAQALRAMALLAQGQLEAGLAALGPEAVQNPTLAQLKARAELAAGRVPEARATVQAALTSSPNDMDLQLFAAALEVQAGQYPAAEAAYRALIARAPQESRAPEMLASLLAAQGRAAEAEAVLTAALAQSPKARGLRILQAAALERNGEVEAALALSEALYEEAPEDLIAANNLASLLATYRGDAASLARASAVAKPLRGTKNPAFMDTYGWIALRENRVAEALSYLEPAALALPAHAQTQAHLAQAYDLANRPAEALAQFRKVLTLAPEPWLAESVQARIAELEGQ